MAEDYPGQDDDISASNYSIYGQTSSYRGRPPMQQIDHPAHNVPEPTQSYNGDPLSLSAPGNSMLRDRALGPLNAKVNVRNGYTGRGDSYGMDQ